MKSKKKIFSFYLKILEMNGNGWNLKSDNFILGLARSMETKLF